MKAYGKALYIRVIQRKFTYSLQVEHGFLTFFGYTERVR